MRAKLWDEQMQQPQPAAAATKATTESLNPHRHCADLCIKPQKGKKKKIPTARGATCLTWEETRWRGNNEALRPTHMLPSPSSSYRLAEGAPAGGAFPPGGRAIWILAVLAHSACRLRRADTCTSVSSAHVFKQHSCLVWIIRNLPKKNKASGFFFGGGGWILVVGKLGIVYWCTHIDTLVLVEAGIEI